MADLELVRSSQDECEYVHQRLQEYNRPYMDESMDFSFHIEDGGRIVAGIVAESTMDTLEIAFLFVDEAYRSRGLGKRLLLHVEEEAKRKGIERVLLNTYSFQAPGFYRAMGYEELLCIDPCFGKYSQHFFSKMLS